MAKLILSLDGIVLKEHELTKERTTIGRKPHNDIQIDNLAVSGEHAVIVTILNDSFLEDTGSTNGTLVNGASVKKHFLQNSDVVEVGKYKLKYINDAVSSTTAADFEKTMVLRAPSSVFRDQLVAKAATDTQVGMRTVGTQAANSTGSSLNRPALAMSAPSSSALGTANTVGVAEMLPRVAKPSLTQTADGFPRPTHNAAASAMPSQATRISSTVGTASQPEGMTMPLAAIQILTGPSAGRELELSKSLTTVGKPGVQVAVITRRPQGYYVTHVEGSSFPILNGKSLDAQAHSLNDHDIVELAGVKMEFFLKN